MMLTYRSFAALSLLALSACAPQNTPSMMNTSRVELVHQTAIEQIPANKVDDVSLALIADDYRRYGNGPVNLAMVFDPKSKTYTAVSARNQLRSIEADLKKRGVSHVETRTMAVEDGEPALMISYESYQAQAPSDCTMMPGSEDNQTGRDLGAYRFGCSTESLIARQIARPADLMGRGALDTADGRRQSNVVEEYRNYGSGDANQPLEQFGQDDI